MKELPISIGVLSWKGYESLNNSLISYQNNGLNQLSSEKYICLPEYTQEGINLSNKFGYKSILLKKNNGISLFDANKLLTSDFKDFSTYIIFFSSKTLLLF